MASPLTTGNDLETHDIDTSHPLNFLILSSAVNINFFILYWLRTTSYPLWSLHWVSILISALCFAIAGSLAAVDLCLSFDDQEKVRWGRIWKTLEYPVWAPVNAGLLWWATQKSVPTVEAWWLFIAMPVLVSLAIRYWKYVNEGKGVRMGESTQGHSN